MPKDPASFAPASRLRAPVLVLGALAFVIHVGCSEEPQPHPGFGTSGTGGTPGNTAGTPANVSGTAGTFATSGSDAGGTFGTSGSGGSDAAGTGGVAVGGTGGTAGTAGTAGTPNGGTGGTPVVVPPLDCTAMAGTALPIPLTSVWGFPDSGEDSFAEAPISGTCAADAPVGAAGCWSMVWTPVTRTFVHWYWHNGQANWTGPGVCVAAGAMAVTLKARADTAVQATFSAAGVNKVVDLTTAWQDVVIDIAGTTYNTLHDGGGVNTGLVVVMAREAADVAARNIYFYDVQWVAEVGGGGEGGAGGGGG